MIRERERELIFENVKNFKISFPETFAACGLHRTFTYTDLYDETEIRLRRTN